VSHFVCSITAYDVMDTTHVAITVHDQDLPEGHPDRFYHRVLTVPGEGLSEPRKWVSHVMAWVVESQ
jgi:hypothetical protein